MLGSPSKNTILSQVISSFNILVFVVDISACVQYVLLNVFQCVVIG